MAVTGYAAAGGEGAGMDALAKGVIAVIFSSRRTDADAAGYGGAAAAMDAEAARQPGYLGFESARDPDGFGITISYWADEASAAAWREHEGHAAIRAEGRRHWYSDYRVVVTEVTRSYVWEAPPGGTPAFAKPAQQSS